MLNHQSLAAALSPSNPYDSGPAPSVVQDLVSLFEAEAAKDPQVTALVMGSRSLTYGELNARANRLARLLITRGANRNSLIGICMERSFDMIEGTLAILKVGAAYVPIDHQYPIERIRHIVSDTTPVLTLTSGAIAREVVGEFGQPVFLDGDGHYADYDSSNLGIAIDPSAICHVMYTSGTSGKPKGVEVPHAGICRLLRHTNYLHLDATDVVLQHSTCSFDAGTFEIWAALLNGGTLALYPQQTLDFATLAGAIANYRVTTLLLTTSVFHLFTEHRIEALGSLRNLVVGGDVMQAKAAKRAIGRFPHLRIVNGYGPTENSVFTSCYCISAGTLIGETVPIGTPITGTNVFVLDEERRPVSPGEIGQLYANGIGMARGYRNRPDLTRERFVLCPFPETGPTMYATGDLVRRDQDGYLHFIGRADNQVKIRGFRVEPAEVESVINVNPNIEDCVVLAETDESGDKSLVAFVKPAGGANVIDASRIRSYVASRLPQYMVPATIVVVPELPLTPNGKVDRSLLRTQLAPTPDGASMGQPPPSEGFDVALRLWREQLRAPALCPDDSIYEHGASSLSVIVVQSKMNDALSCSVEAQDVAAAQTPRQWGSLYETAIRSASSNSGSLA